MSKLKVAFGGYQRGRPNPYGLSDLGMNQFSGGMPQGVHPSMEKRLGALNDTIRNQFRQKALSGGVGSTIPYAAAFLRSNAPVSRASRELADFRVVQQCLCQNLRPISEPTHVWILTLSHI